VSGGAEAGGEEAGGEATAGRGVRQVLASDFSLEQAIGGWRGLVESVAPGLVFVVVYVATRELTPSIVASLGVALVTTTLRLVSRSPVTQAVSGLGGVVIGVLWAWRSGEAQDYFAWGLVTNVVFAVAVLVSILVRWPLVGLVVGAFRQSGTGWRQDRAAMRRYTAATWVWFALFAARLLVQVPLYWQAEVGWLGTARLVMGLPLWALTLWLTWVLVREPGAPAARPAPPRSEPT
jgi:uncharacterized protein DUF3159